MILPKSNFKARLTEIPEVVDQNTKEKVRIGRFTIGKKYRIYAVFDNGQFCDFLTADDAKEFHWINIKAFRAI